MTKGYEDAALVQSAAQVRQGVIRLGRRLRAERSPEALSVNKLGVLSHLHRHGPATAGELAAAEHQRPQSLTRVFAELEQAGLMTRIRDERDRRQSVLAITPAGTTALARDMAERDAWLASAMAGLSDTERQVLRLAGALMDRLADDPPRPARHPARPGAGDRPAAH
ncbi:MarR family transcriptional regulator [Actinoallomurus purpureus]|uniref:MarR family winged helix-turn-helix transcriptional regulator n=1 Tax=Actinoallomurus purpureus TaxID=478114 RepID=UPI0020923589|nr:MarR family transcriptional regulator [Actinoallomurus purpureus]MCO6004115.1 MarR family transcriptional regulator [Actinoallomurus purpureus]